MQLPKPFFRIVASSLDNTHAAIDDCADITRIVRRRNYRQKRQVHAEWLARHFAAAPNLVCKCFRRSLRQGGYDAESTGIRDGGSQFGEADVMHATLNDWMVDAE